MAARQEPLLESWKEISAYLKRSERTCKRWENALGLPVHRLDGTPNARVFAYPSELDRWLNEKLHHRDNEVQGEKEPRAAPVRRAMRGLAIAAAAAAVALIALATRSLFFRVALVIPDEKPTVAVMPFANEGGNATWIPWTTALPDLIATDLAQSRVVNAVRVTDLTRALAELKMADPVPLTSDGVEAVAAKVRADQVVTGRFAGTGRSQALILAIHSRGQRSPKEIRVDLANEKEIFRTVDTLTRRMKYALGLTRAQVSGDLDRDVRRISTGSPQAFKQFSQGIRLLAIADYQDGVARLLETVAMDPEFALAYKYLFRGCENSLRADDAKAHALKAAGLADRMSERERGEFLYLFHDRYTGDEVKKRQSLERLCRFYPDDRFGSTLLLGYYADREEWAGGLPLAERAWNANTGDANLTTRLAQFYENTGRADQAERVLGEFIDANPEHRYLPNVLDWRSSFFVRSGQAIKALADLDRRGAHFPNRPRPRLPRAHIYMHGGDFAAAERELRPAAADATADPRERIGLLAALAEMDLMRGRPEAALLRLREGLDIAARLPGAGKDRQAILMTTNIHMSAAYLLRLVGRLPEAVTEIELASDQGAKSRLRGEPPPLEIWHLRALILLDMGRWPEFEAQAEEIRRAVVEGERPRLARVYYHLIGCRELKKNDPGKAIEYLSRAVDQVSVPGSSFYGPPPWYFYDLARAYAMKEGALGWGRAVPLFERAVGSAVDRVGWGDVYALSHYELALRFEAAARSSSARAAQRREALEKAKAHFGTFLDLWGDAEPPFSAQVEDARRRLAALRSE